MEYLVGTLYRNLALIPKVISTTRDAFLLSFILTTFGDTQCPWALNMAPSKPNYYSVPFGSLTAHFKPTQVVEEPEAKKKKKSRSGAQEAAPTSTSCGVEPNEGRGGIHDARHRRQ